LVVTGGSLDWNDGLCDGNTAGGNGGCFLVGPGAILNLGDGAGAGVELTATNAVTQGTNHGNQGYIAGNVVAASDATLRHSTVGPTQPAAPYDPVEDYYLIVGDMCWAGANAFPDVLITNQAGVEATLLVPAQVYCNDTTCDTTCPSG
jgi:hypothetical protein